MPCAPTGAQSVVPLRGLLQRLKTKAKGEKREAKGAVKQIGFTKEKWKMAKEKVVPVVKKGGPDERSEWLKIRVSEVEKEQIKNLAAGRHENVADMIRCSLLKIKPNERRYVFKEVPNEYILELRALRADLARLGNNVNQLVRHRNEGYVVDDSEVGQCIGHALNKLVEIDMNITEARKEIGGKK